MYFGVPFALLSFGCHLDDLLWSWFWVLLEVSTCCEPKKERWESDEEVK
jgi:hypothetical protein